MDYYQLAAVIIPVIGMVVGAVLYINRFRTKESCNNIREDCQKRYIDERREIWAKIDQMHNWMITGVIKINRD